MTDRLYYTDSYLREFTATVIGSGSDGQTVYLDRTAFYPTSGGQPHDTGALDGAEVVDVVDEGEQVAHLLAGRLTGDRVTGRIDWVRRFDHMQQHTGQHLLSAVIADLFGHATVSVHFGRDSSTLDLDAAELTAEQVTSIEDRANEVVTENRPVSVSFEDAATVTGLRKAPDRQGSLRIVSIQDLDRTACGGTHLRATGEIGPILIRGIERVRKAVRLHFLCGGRAVRRARSDHDLLSRLSAFHSTGADELPALMDAQRAGLKELTATLAELERRLDSYRAAELYGATVPDAGGRRVVMAKEAAGSIERLRGLGQAVATRTGAVFVGAIVDPPGIVVAAAEDTGVDANRVLKAGLVRVGGRGGGTSRMAQGTVRDGAALELALAALTAAL